MSIRIQRVGHGIGHFFTAAKRIGVITVAAASLCAGSAGLLLPSNVRAVEPCGEPSEDPSILENEGSLLVATRDADAADHPAMLPEGDDVEGTALEPIPQNTEHTPELADLTSAEMDADDQFGSALASATEKQRAHRESSAADLGAAYRDGVAAEPAKFNGIQPGQSTRQDVLEAWDEPSRTVDTQDGAVLTFDVEPFASVDVLISGQTVAAIKVELQGYLPPKRLAKQLALDKIESVLVTDADGVALGEAYPERGVLFMFAAPSASGAKLAADAAPAVTHVVIQPLDAQAFALRAESRLHGPYQQNIQDLEFALSLDPQLAQAHWLLAEIYLATGQSDRAEAAAHDACDLMPEDAAYLLRHAQTLKALGRYDDAARNVRSVLDRDSTPPIVKAQALHEMAKLAARGEANIASKAIPFDSKAIELADLLATSRNVKERRAAKELLVEAHLSIANEIASHSFKNKVESVSEWIGRASGLAEAMIADDGGSMELRLLVAREALSALAGFKPTKDPAPWVAEAKQAAEALAAQWDDELWQSRVKWELGQAYSHALRVEHSRLQSAAALRYGQLAIENLADGAKTRQAVYESEQLIGELYFQIGAVHAVHKQDHKTATAWYDKAVPLLTSPKPVSELLTSQRDGEELVSMGVSYWQNGDKDHALELTLSGAELVQRAVDDGVLPDSSLAVPYGNLASMYKELGETSDAAKYAELARASGAVQARSTRNASTAGTTQSSARRSASTSSSRHTANSGPRPVTSSRPASQTAETTPPAQQSTYRSAHRATLFQSK